MGNLITAPTFQFKQGELYEDEGAEYPVQVVYFNDGVISLEQNDNSIVLSKKWLDGLFKAIKKHLPEAEKELTKKANP